MDAVMRAVAIYFFLLIVFRLAGQRTLANLTTFDFVLLLVIAEATQQGLLGEDFSVTNAFLVIVTLIGIDIGLSLLKNRFLALDKLLEGVPLVIVVDGKPLKDRMERARVDESDVLVAARERQGLERLDQIRYAVLERTGEISIIPKRQPAE
ncbi:MAG TPA: YetF domain-containing protein [Candidatus Binatia bacterium]|jgi:uncharacterized membrane protein YcaP (DUF421 family)